MRRVFPAYAVALAPYSTLTDTTMAEVERYFEVKRMECVDEDGVCRRGVSV